MLLSLINYAINSRAPNVNAKMRRAYGTAKKFKFPLLSVSQLKLCAVHEFKIEFSWHALHGSYFK